ncbi:hypothetical protein V500_11525 [Pseudogymnoascus sp. VKM F-4518 (FW-2643)]|nr:hypothetical protein V500_11525 [Pseudogymnoascus sp. VKM F-4518 (FW-2643)]
MSEGKAGAPESPKLSLKLRLKLTCVSDVNPAQGDRVPAAHGVFTHTYVATLRIKRWSSGGLFGGPIIQFCLMDGMDEMDGVRRADLNDTTPATGVTREYWLVAENTTVASDGFSQYLLAFNGTIPGPTLYAEWGDEMIIHVTKEMENNGTSVHWHGIRQLNNNEMDGVPGVTQCCPITPGETYTYKWRATQYGTSWYHSHFSFQYLMGLQGAIAINGLATANYDEDLGPLFLQDWNHIDLFNGWWWDRPVTGPPNQANSLINGTNVFNCNGLSSTICFGNGTRGGCECGEATIFDTAPTYTLQEMSKPVFYSRRRALIPISRAHSPPEKCRPCSPSPPTIAAMGFIGAEAISTPRALPCSFSSAGSAVRASSRRAVKIGGLGQAWAITIAFGFPGRMRIVAYLSPLWTRRRLEVVVASWARLPAYRVCRYASCARKPSGLQRWLSKPDYRRAQAELGQTLNQHYNIQLRPFASGNESRATTSYTH